MLFSTIKQASIEINLDRIVHHKMSLNYLQKSRSIKHKTRECQKQLRQVMGKVSRKRDENKIQGDNFGITWNTMMKTFEEEDYKQKKGRN